MNNNPYLYDLARHTMRENEQRTAQRRLLTARRPRRPRWDVHVLTDLIRRLPVAGTRHPVTTRTPTTDPSPITSPPMRPTAT